jgi:DNA repair protein SbcD/Mre11
MRFIHTADWHLGRILHGTSLLEDQLHALDGLCELVRDVKPNAVVVSGDIYDRATPPADAVAALDEVLTRLVVDCRTRVIVIAGNHDSPERIGFASRVLAGSGLTLVGSLSPEPVSVVVSDAGQTVRIWAVPYADPPTVAWALGDDLIRGHEAAMLGLLARIRSRQAGGERAVLVAHAFVSGGAESESERPLSVGGTGAVAASVFDGFDYVALGHLHRPQSMPDERLRYAGSLLKYSFSEWEHSKSISLVELPPTGPARVEELTLPITHDVRKIRGKLADLLASAPPAGSDDYIWADLLDETPVFNALERLRSVYPNVLYAARVETLGPGAAPGGPRPDDLQRLSLSELFRMFYQEVNGDALPAPHEPVFLELMREFEQSREAR